LIKLICLNLDLDIDLDFDFDLDLDLDLAPAATLLAVENLHIDIVHKLAKRDFSSPASQRNTTVDGNNILPARARTIMMNNYHMQIFPLIEMIKLVTKVSVHIG
jgi:hypothetical protein